MTWEEAAAEIEAVLELVRDKANWTPELFERVRIAPNTYYRCPDGVQRIVCVFNRIRLTLPEEQYAAWDGAYCGYLRPQDKDLVIVPYEKQKKEAREPRTKRQKEYMKRGNVAKNQPPSRMTTEELFVKLYGMNWSGNVAKNQSPPRMTTEEMFVKLYGMNWKEK